MNVLDVEPAPALLDAQTARDFGYGIYSARYGNIYTARMLRQLVDECFADARFDDLIWEKDGRYYDAKRPAIEPDGFESPAELLAMRAAHVAAVRGMFKQAHIFVFTLGLTEGWISDHGTAFAGAPGTIAGSYDPARCQFVNHRYGDILADMSYVIAKLRSINPWIRFLLTVSPVPLTATATTQHVLPATGYSKAVLRAVAGDLAHDLDYVDYFPSFEMITGHYGTDSRFDAACASVLPLAVAQVMSLFAQCYGLSAREPVIMAPEPPVKTQAEIDMDIVCEEQLLSAFAEIEAGQ